MTRLTYDEALDTIIEHTEMGYTIASQDRLWIVFTFDLDSEGEMLSLKYNRLFPLIDKTSGARTGGWSYDLMSFGHEVGVPVWTTRTEAEEWAEELRGVLADYHASQDREGEPPPVYVMNLGDDARIEALWIGRYGTRPRTKPKYAGSREAWAACHEMSKRWAEEVSPHIEQFK